MPPLLHSCTVVKQLKGDPHMKYGMVLSFGTHDQILEMAREAEAAGWDGIFTWDDVAITGVESYDPWPMLGALATITERVTLGAMIFAFARRKPWEVARQVLTVDHLSGGRLVLPVALGVPDDGGFSRVNTDTADRRIRAERLDECLEYLDRAAAGEIFSFEGKHYQSADMQFIPRPIQQPRVPVWTVAQWPAPKSMSRAARWDGILPTLKNFPPLEPSDIADVKKWMIEHRDIDAPFELIIEGRTTGTDREADRAQLAPIAAAGATWFIESRWDDTDTPESLLERVRQGPPS